MADKVADDRRSGLDHDRSRAGRNEVAKATQGRASGPDEDDASAGFTAAVGERLRLVRRQRHLSLQAVESVSNKEFKASVLGAYERGERSISVPRLQRLARLYEVPVDQLLPHQDQFLGGEVAPLDGVDPDVEEDPRRRSAPLPDKVAIDLMKLSETPGPERDLLRHFLRSIQVQRQDFNGRVITIRGEDLRIMASMLGRSPEMMIGRLEELGLVFRS